MRLSELSRFFHHIKDITRIKLLRQWGHGRNSEGPLVRRSIGPKMVQFFFFSFFFFFHWSENGSNLFFHFIFFFIFGLFHFYFIFFFFFFFIGPKMVQNLFFHFFLGESIFKNGDPKFSEKKNVKN